jgi:hypothetical protein
MNEDKELFLPDTTVKLGTLRRVLNDTYGLDIIKLKMATNTEIASTIVNQLGGMGRLNMMTGAYNFGALPNGVTFRIKNQRANVIKITLTSMDLYNLEVGRLRGGKYTIVTENLGLYNDMLKPAIEKATGMYLSLQDGGTLLSTRRFTDNDFDKLMESGLFRAHKSVVLLNIYPTNGSKLVGKFNSEKEYIYISGKKDLSNPLVEWLSENSYVTSDEYRSLADGGGVGGTFDSSSTGEVLGGTYGSSESGEMIGGTMASSMYAKGSTLRASNSPVLEFVNFEDDWHINLLKLNPNRNQQSGLLYKGGNKYAVIRISNKGKQELFEFKTLEQAEDKFDKLVTQSTTFSPISTRGKIEGNYANGGGVGEDKNWSGFVRYRMEKWIPSKGQVIENLESKKYHTTAKDSYEAKNNIQNKFLNDTDYKDFMDYSRVVLTYANGGGIGGTSDSAEMDAPTLGGTMSSSMFEGDTYSNRFENKLWNEIADGTPHSFKKGGKVSDCGCKEKYDEGGNAECGCWHYDIGGL